jgi:hypothetical protein
MDVQGPSGALRAQPVTQSTLVPTLVPRNLPLYTQCRTKTSWDTPKTVGNTQVKLWHTPFAAAKPHI